MSESISPQQCRSARAWLGWTLDNLAEKSKVSRATIVPFERGTRMLQTRTAIDLRRAFEDVGIIFLFEGARAAGIQFDPNKVRPEKGE